MKTLVFFNNKSGVGKTSLTYHLAWMFADLGLKVVAVDLDPQSNLTSSFLREEQLEELWEPRVPTQTIMAALQPLLDQMGELKNTELVTVDDRIALVPGDIGLSRFEDRLSDTWGKCLEDRTSIAADAFRVTTAFYRVMDNAAKAFDAELVLIDVGPNLGAINRAALVAADFVVIPVAADLFSLQVLRNLGPTLSEWRQGWETRKKNKDKPTDILIPAGKMSPVGYVVMQPSVRENSPLTAYRRWIERIPDAYRTEVLGEKKGLIPIPDPYQLATLRNYRSLAPMAQEAHKPMFSLKPADGALGGHVGAVKDCQKQFREMATRIAEACGLSSLVPV